MKTRIALLALACVALVALAGCTVPAASTGGSAATPSSPSAPAKTAPAAGAPKSYTDGTYLVGTDIPAGRYKGKVTSDLGSGYWQISKDANGQEIVSNNIVSGPFYCQVKKGQYLELSGVEIVPAK